MARVEYNPVPQVSARESVPDDYLRVEASPAAFGAGLGQGLEQLGQGGIEAAKFYSHGAANQGVNNFLEQREKLLYGDPSKTVVGPDGQPVPDAGFFGLRGQNAMDAAAGVQKQLQDLYQKTRNTVPTPEGQELFDNEARRYLAQSLSEIGSHTDREQKTWLANTNSTSLNLALNDVSRQPLDDKTVADVTNRARSALVKNAQLAGEDAQGAVLKADQEVALARVRALITNDPANAQKVFDQSKGILGSLPNYDQIGRQVKEAVINATLSPAIDKAVGEATQQAVGTIVAPGKVAVAPDALHAAILGQESGDNSNAPTSVNGAVGPGQMLPATFSRFAKPGERIDNPADNRAVASRALDFYYQKYGDAGRAAVAYFSGEGNVAPEGSPTPWKRDAHDGNGKTVSSYVSDVEAKLGATGRYSSVADALSAGMEQTLDKAQKTAEQLFPNYPDAQERYVVGVQRRLERAISQQHQLMEVDAHTVQSVMASDQPPISEAELLSRGPRVAQAWKSMQLTNPYGAMAVERMFDANAHGQALTYGARFMDYLDRVTAPATDPNRITSPSGLWPFVGKGENAQITNTGVNQLSELMQARSGPQGEAFASQARAFFHQMHGNLTFSNRGTGVVDVRGEALFNRFVAQAMPVLLNAQKTGKLGEVLDPKSPDYLGNMAQTFARPPAQVMNDRLKFAQTSAIPNTRLDVRSLGTMLDGLDTDQQRAEALKAAVASHRLDEATYRTYLAGKRAAQGAPVSAAPDLGDLDKGSREAAVEAAHKKGILTPEQERAYELEHGQR